MCMSVVHADIVGIHLEGRRRIIRGVCRSESRGARPSTSSESRSEAHVHDDIQNANHKRREREFWRMTDRRRQESAKTRADPDSLVRPQR